MYEYDDNDELLNDEYVNKVIEDVNNNIDLYTKYITDRLVNWTYDRLDNLEKAILLCGCSEIKSNINPKNIVIDECIRISKEYNDEQSYKFINGVLDNL